MRDRNTADLPWWHPDEVGRRTRYLQGRAQAVRSLRAWFAEQEFVEVETPALQVSPGLETHLHAFAVELEGPHPDDRSRLYLHTSPEFAMKKLLAGGFERIVQMCHVFRNRERSATHHPEFTMLEWYRAHAGYQHLMADCISLIRRCCRDLGVEELLFRGRRCDPHGDWESLTVADAFRRYADIDLLSTAPDPACPDRDLIGLEAERIGIRTAETDTWEDVVFRILLDRVEPKLGIGVPTFLTDYPVSMAALARPKPADPRLAERFELYVCGLELANAFGELIDPVLQRQWFERDMDEKERLYGERYPIDEDFLSALAHGLPPSAGIALGLDRLVMLLTGADRIEDVLWAPVVGSLR